MEMGGPSSICAKCVPVNKSAPEIAKSAFRVLAEATSFGMIALASDGSIRLSLTYIIRSIAKPYRLFDAKSAIMRADLKGTILALRVMLFIRSGKSAAGRAAP